VVKVPQSAAGAKWLYDSVGRCDETAGLLDDMRGH
jgi:hypothetical protein